MQEYVQERSVALIMRGTRLTGGLFQKTISALHNRIKNPKLHRGKQSLGHLVRHGKTVNSMDINDPGMKLFDRVARKHHVNYTIQVDKTAVKGNQKKYILFFHADQAELINRAFSEFTAKMLQKKKSKFRPSVLRQLQYYKRVAKVLMRNIRNKQQEKAR